MGGIFAGLASWNVVTHDAGARGFYALAHMWTPGVAALIASRLTDRPAGGLGWPWPARRYLLIAYLTPLVYSACACACALLMSVGAFSREFFAPIRAQYGWFDASDVGVAVRYLAWSSTAAVLSASLFSLGEELGWRGFLVSSLASRRSATSVALLSGMAWVAWHMPIFFFPENVAELATPRWYAMCCYAVMLLGMSFPLTWLRLRSRSVWPAVVFHTTHNVFNEDIFGPFVKAMGPVHYWTGETGALMAVASALCGFLFWRLPSFRSLTTDLQRE